MTDGADDGRGEQGALPPILRITEFTDAACPWAWGSEPAFRLLRHTLGPLAEWRRVFGVLFGEVAGHTGAPYAHRLRWLTRSSWPAAPPLSGRPAGLRGPAG
ncbi:DsbA family protein [Streptomyces sp. NBS 14/10]|uniref:DsbA family protein n=1 Tax=Streptomyces sp. NBS 14/10 TaxID=1945643 RepID=UPI000B7D2844|nr:DsbA family protein [Streptomyces sp. NBS 14/10]KAK1177201.1 DsbA family protein [Streptomyces sp. NBS 14/10]